MLLLFSSPALAQERRTFTIPFRTAPGGSSLIVEMQAEGKRRVLVLDTGSRFTILSGKPEAKCESSKDISTAFGRDRSFCAADVEWALGEHRGHGRILFGPLVGFDGTGVDGVLGQDVLRTFSAIRIDYKAQIVTLEE